MRKFFLLLKNSFKIFVKSKWQILQLLLLISAGVVVVTSTALSDFSLRSELNIVKQKSNAPDISFKNTNKKDYFDWDLYLNNRKLDDNYEFKFDEKTVHKSEKPFYVYDPTFISKVNGFDFYGFNLTYNDNGVDTSGNLWSNIIYNNRKEAQTVDTKQTLPIYKNKLMDFYSFYNSVVSPNANDIKNNGYDILYELSNYAFNPWSLFIDDKGLVSSDLGCFYFIDEKNNFINIQDFSLNHGVIYKDNMQLVGTDICMNNSFSEKVNNEVILKNSSLIGNQILQPLKTKFIDKNDFVNFVKIKSGTYVDVKNIFPDNYFDFVNNNIINSLISKTGNEFNYFSKSYGWIPIDYKVSIKSSTGYMKALSNIYFCKDNEIPNELKSIKKLLTSNFFQILFEGKARIPLIPFLTITPKNKLSNEEFIKWKNSPQDWNETSILDTKNIFYVIKQSLSDLNKKSINFLKQKLEELYVTDPKSIDNFLKFYDNENSIYALFSKMGLDVSSSKSYVVNSNENGSFIVTSNKRIKGSEINKLVLHDGSNLVAPLIQETQAFSNHLTSIDTLQQKWISLVFRTEIQYTDQQICSMLWEDKLFLKYVEILSNAIMYTTSDNIKDIWTNKLSIMVKKPDLLDPVSCQTYVQSCGGYFDKFRVNSLLWTGFGYSICLNVKYDTIFGSQWIEFFASTIDPTSTLAIVGQNYTKLKSKDKQILKTWQKINNQDVNILYKALKLPYFVSPYLNQKMGNENLLWDYNNNVQKQFKDFSTWFEEGVPEKNKITINGNDYLIIGSGISNEFLYPILSSSQLLLNNDSPVVFMNNSGFERSMFGISGDYVENVWLKNNSGSLVSKLYDVNKLLKEYNSNESAYLITDNQQPDKLLFLRINFLDQVLSIILNITMTIGIIIILLTVFFVLMIIRSFFKQNINVFGVCMANGVDKHSIALSFFPFILIPGFLSSLIGYGLSLLIYPLFSKTIQNYWILDYLHMNFNILIPILTFIIVSVFLFLIAYTIIIIFTSKQVPTLLNKNVDYNYRTNAVSKLFSKKLAYSLSPMTSFRVWYVLGNFKKIIILFIAMASFSSLITIQSSLKNVFTEATSESDKNKLYDYAIDLYSPTEQGGYYYDISYDQIGSRKLGLESLYDLNVSNAFFPNYDKKYKNALTYNFSDPDNSNIQKSIVYENLFLPSVNIISAVQNNIQFLKNNIIYLGTFNADIKFNSVNINPWKWAMKMLPTNLTQMAYKLFQKQLNLAFEYFVRISKNNFNNVDDGLWKSSKETKLYDDLHQNFKDPNVWTQDNWIFQYKLTENKKYEWVANTKDNVFLNKNLLTTNAVKLITTILSFNLNPSYKKFIKDYHPDLQKTDYNFLLGLNVIPVDKQKDETYTYLSGKFISDKNSFNDKYTKIYGIKPNSNNVVLYDERNDKDLKQELSKYDESTEKMDYYPLIINEVVARKYRLHVGDYLDYCCDNKYDRFVKKANNIVDNEKYKFKILGISNSKSQEWYYTTQTVANKILGFNKPKKLPNDNRKENYENAWVDQTEIDSYVPFNGLFSKIKNPYIFLNFSSLYSPSGLSPLSPGLPDTKVGDSYQQIKKSFVKLNKILHVDNFVPNEINSENKVSYELVNQFNEKFYKVFGTNKYLTSSVQDIDVKVASGMLGTYLDNTIGNVSTMCILALIPSLIVIITSLSYIMIVEFKRAISLLKILGYNDLTNTITLSTVLVLSILISILFSLLVSFVISNMLVSKILFTFNILISPELSWKTMLFGLPVLLLIVGVIMINTLINLRKLNPAKEIVVNN